MCYTESRVTDILFTCCVKVSFSFCMTHSCIFGPFNNTAGQPQDPLTAPLAPLEGLQIKSVYLGGNCRLAGTVFSLSLTKAA